MLTVSSQRREPELKFILHAMFAANFGIYEEAWKAIGLVLFLPVTPGIPG